MPLRTSASIEELSFDFSALDCSRYEVLPHYDSPGIIVIPVSEELSEHLLNVI